MKAATIASPQQSRLGGLALPRAAPARARAARPARRAVAVSAKGKDFDQIMIENAERFEKAENKVAIVGWSTGAFGAVVVAEWLIHLPLFDFLLGFPIQLLGLVAAANLALKYYVDNEGDALTDFEAFVGKVSKKLPGL